jgi:NIPSNAP
MIYELRIYTCCPGRLPDLIDRFRDHTLALWAKHGIRTSGFWTTVIGESSQDLTYMLAWQDMAERERVWQGFVTDPEWAAIRRKTESAGPIIANIRSSLLAPTDFSPLR